MTDEIWEARRRALADQVLKASHDLLAHTGSTSFCLPFGDGYCVAAGPIDRLPALAAAATSPIKD
jgi:hypothetical protein